MRDRYIPPLSWRWIGFMGGVAALYALVARLSLLLAFENTNASPVWPPAGIAFAAVLLLGYRIWPGIILGAIIANVWVFLSNDVGHPIAVVLGSTGIAIGTTLESCTGSLLFRRFIGDKNALSEDRDVILLVCVGVIMCTVSALIGPLSICLTGLASWGAWSTMIVTWWLGDFSGVLVVTPLFLGWQGRPQILASPTKFAEGLVLLATLIAMGEFVFGTTLHPGVSDSLVFLVIPVLIWAAYRLGPRETAIAVALISGIAIWGTVKGRGPFSAQTLNTSLLLVQGFICTIVITALSLAAEIAQRRRMTFIVEEHANMLNTIIESARDAMISVDENGHITLFNHAAENMFGWQQDEILDQPFTRLIPEDCREENERHIMCYFSKDAPPPAPDSLGEMPGVRKDGSQLVMGVSLASGQHEGQRSVIAIARDITQQKQAEKALKESEEKYRLLVENQTDMVVKFNPDGTLLFASPSYCKTFGKKQQDLIGHRFAPFIHEEDLPTFKEAMSHLDSPPYSVYVEERAMTAIGWRWQGWLNTAIHDENGKTQAIVAVGRDITDRKKAEQAARLADRRLLKQEQKAKQLVEEELTRVRDELIKKTRLATIGQLSASIGHELRNPLGAIRNAAYLLRRRTPAEAQDLPRYINMIDEEVNRAETTISDLMEMSRPKDPIHQQINLATILHQASTHACLPVGVEMETTLDDDSCIVCGDPAQLQQVFCNLFINAVQAMDGRGTIRVDMEQSGLYDDVIVRDTGPGVPEDQRERLFEPLFSTRAKGTGLGLTICRQIIDRHGGKIELVASDEPGAVFRVRLPRRQPTAPLQNTETGEAERSHPTTP